MTEYFDIEDEVKNFIEEYRIDKKNDPTEEMVRQFRFILGEAEKFASCYKTICSSLPNGYQLVYQTARDPGDDNCLFLRTPEIDHYWLSVK